MEFYAIRDAVEHQDYYSLFYYETDLGIIICSEKLYSKHFRENLWKEIPNQSVLSISGSPPIMKLVNY